MTETPLARFIEAMPKVELHVHLEGSIQPETLLALARRNHVELPADTAEGLRPWYAFTDFPHFIEVYLVISRCLRTPEDIEWITREFLAGQARENILHSEVTFTPYLHYHDYGIPFGEQLEAVNKARTWAAETLGVSMALVIDIPRYISAEEGVRVADWAISGMGNGVDAFGLGGPEVDHPPEKFEKAFQKARDAGLPSVPHAGETVGPDSIWGSLKVLGAERIGHGVRCLEDPSLVEVLRDRQIPLEVCPTSNICLKVFPSLEEHPIARLIDAGLFVTVNSDDPPLFNTTLTDELRRVSSCFSFGSDRLMQFTLDALSVSLLDESSKAAMREKIAGEFEALVEFLPEPRDR